MTEAVTLVDRRAFLAGGLGAAASGALPVGPAGASPPPPLPPFVADVERRTFLFFWETANPANGLVPDRWPTPSFSSIAAVGFALTAYPIGVERGWVTRAEARARTLATLRFFAAAPQGDAAAGTSGYRGFFYHFLDMRTGRRFRECELSSVDSTLLFLGMLHVAGWFDGDDADERAIRALAAEIVDRAEWPWFQHRRDAISMGWHPGRGFIERAWEGYNEGMMVVLLALGSGRHRVADGAWEAWTRPYPAFWRGEGPTRHLAFAPLFGHQYSHVWIDFRDIRDAVMRREGLDYFENSRRATYADRAYCIANPMGWAGYGRDLWGLTACDGPADVSLPFRGRTAQFHGYAARGPVGQPDGLDDGTLAPTAALGSMPFAPEICIPAAVAMRGWAGGRLIGRYGFLDSFNPSFRYVDRPVTTGSVDARRGWIAKDYLGIDQGPILAMLANYRAETVWRVMRRSPVIRRGLTRAGFTGGWLAQ